MKAFTLASDLFDTRLDTGDDVGFGALALEHVDDVAGGAVAEELPERLFVERDAVFFRERGHVGGREAGERGFAEMRVLAEEVFRGAMEVGEVAAAAA